ncbi:hypothetical protein WJX81_000840 [Elliptochloris bilobata]|uniref:Dynein regulatory complex subunit 7 C-terminal domain-containing protein n=1 Tax=Elliptochloris bilobata TaxID=381761 RepID=A0AAW1SJ59_9CHLO
MREAVQEAAREAAGSAAARERQEQAIALEMPYWDVARGSGGGADPDGAAPEPPRPADYLTPYLPMAAAALKQRLVERAHIIQARRNEEAATLARREAALAREREQAGGEAGGAEGAVAESRFRLRILDRRLKANEEHALARYQALVARLAADVRLAALWDQ